MSQITEEQIAEIEGLLAATEGPWFIRPRPTDDGLSVIEDGREHGLFPIAGEHHDISVIVALRNAAPALLSAARRGIAAGGADVGALREAIGTAGEVSTLADQLEEARGDGVASWADPVMQSAVKSLRSVAAALASPPAAAEGAGDMGAEDTKEVRDLAWRMWREDQPGIIWSEDNRRWYRAKARAALSQPPAPAEGWRLMPIDPTDFDGMMEAGFDAMRDGAEWGRQVSPADVWKAMAEALPAAPEARS